MDNSQISGLQMLMASQMAAEFELAHRFTVPWISDRDPPGIGSYLTACINGDGAEYVAIHYFGSDAWLSAGPFVRVLRWYWVPAL
jgi:hypothetical protein